MDIKDLMIGDWVLINPWDYRKPFQPCKVVAISYNSYRGKDYTDWIDCDYWDDISPSDIGPIPLTEEILMLNFPKPYDIRWFPEDDSKDVFCIAWEEPIGLGYSMNIAIRYVHELQHALRLCGIDKEIIVKEAKI